MKQTNFSLFFINDDFYCFALYYFFFSFILFCFLREQLTLCLSPYEKVTYEDVFNANLRNIIRFLAFQVDNSTAYFQVNFQVNFQVSLHVCWDHSSILWRSFGESSRLGSRLSKLTIELNLPFTIMCDMMWYVEKTSVTFSKSASLQTEGGRYKRAVNTNQLGEMSPS